MSGFNLGYLFYPFIYILVVMAELLSLAQGRQLSHATELQLHFMVSLLTVKLARQIREIFSKIDSDTNCHSVSGGTLGSLQITHKSG